MRRSRTDTVSIGERGARRAVVAGARGAQRRTAHGVVLVGALGAACGGGSPRPGASCAAERVVLASQADIARVAHCATLRNLTVRTAGALDASPLGSLATITGDLVIGPTVGVDAFALGGLRVVGGAIRVVGNGMLQGFYAPRLERAGAIAVASNVALKTISLPRLMRAGALRVTDNAGLEALDVAALAVLDDALVIAGVPALTWLDAGALRSAGHVELDARALPAEQIAQLRGLAP